MSKLMSLNKMGRIFRKHLKERFRFWYETSCSMVLSKYQRCRAEEASKTERVGPFASLCLRLWGKLAVLNKQKCFDILFYKTLVYQMGSGQHEGHREVK
jgi:hypothetical protein